ncbi:MAG TPA: HEAT repeat domain-containing protein, partial [Longimicrobiales bacterium]|nr:HEAT repeat domain-containing protein [Longimicrobiales bacterium]
PPASGPSSPGPAPPAPSAPAPLAPGGPGPTGGSATPAGPQGGGGPGSGADLGFDGTSWNLWWHFNRHPHLALKSHIGGGQVISGSDDFFLGHGGSGGARDSLRPSPARVRAIAVPALLAALEASPSPDLATSALVALARIGEDPTGEAARISGAIRRFTAHANQEVAETAVLSLGILGDAAELDLLARILDGDLDGLRRLDRLEPGMRVAERTRAFAAYALGLLGREAGGYERLRIVRALARTLEREGSRSASQDVPVACVLALGLVPLGVDGSDQAGEVRRTAVLVTRQQQVRFLLWAFDHGGLDPLVRAHVPTSVARLLDGVPEGSALRALALRRLLEPLEKKGSEPVAVRQSAALALGDLCDGDGDPWDAAARRALMGAAEGDAESQVRHFALIALAQCSGRPGAGAGDALAGTPEARSFLLRQLGRGRSEIRAWSAIALGLLERSVADSGRLPSADALSALRTSLAQARSPSEVGAYALALGLARDAGAREVLLERLEKVSDPDARGYVALGLGLIGAREAVGAIESVLERSRYQPELLRSAAIALGLLGDKAVVADLLAMLEKARALSSQAAIASALGQIGDTRSLEPLAAMLADGTKTDLARAFAAVALGIVCDREDLPWGSELSSGVNYRANPATLTSAEAGTGVLDIL